MKTTRFRITAVSLTIMACLLLARVPRHDDSQRQTICAFVMLDEQPVARATVFCIPDQPLARVVSYRVRTDDFGYFEFQPEEDLPAWRVVIRKANEFANTDGRPHELDRTQHALRTQALPRSTAQRPVNPKSDSQNWRGIPAIYSSPSLTPLLIDTRSEALITTDLHLSSAVNEQLASREIPNQTQ